MEERRRGCSVATEAPSPLLGLVAIAVLPPSGCCAAAEELEGMSRCRRALSPSCCVAAHLFFTVAAHLFLSGSISSAKLITFKQMMMLMIMSFIKGSNCLEISSCWE
ncbi:uncharacterized protein LOC110267245 isoform X2 [Arachis ipaensis]|uniref:uncharacterized protein LOC110267245 isoform X2 n=1 Tax=Arachis ipaensis TaxID=130454 RepID=UPI000A2B5497|nr:uncharacterized protein LOC110267245 isoform X2 [Arachis ipaensis]